MIWRTGWTIRPPDNPTDPLAIRYCRVASFLFSIDKTSITGLIESISQPGGNFTYTYDDNGNIISVVQDGKKTTYEYDALGQLIRVDDEQEGATWEYEYDQGGNILSKTKHVEGKSDETTAFSYTNPNWKDQLTAVNGKQITYDAIGNPESDGTWTYTWEKGRQLKRMQSVDTDASFVYNENGLRVQKTVNGVVTNYTLHGKNIVHLTRGSDNLHFFYDAQGKPAIVEYNGTKYAYVCNLQGDIVAILDSSKNVVVSYVYDAWGHPIKKEGSLASKLGMVQPFRYRGYVYDEETGLYYLRSRYYNSDKCRFINEDSILGTIRLIAHNSYSYCRNCPVIKIDSSGCNDAPAVQTPGPTSLPTPRPSRPDGWDYEYRMAEQRRLALKAVERIVEAIFDADRYVEAQQMLASGSGQITLKNGYKIYYISEDKYNKWYRERNSDPIDAIINIGRGTALQGLGHLASNFEKFAKLNPLLSTIGILDWVYSTGEVITNVYIDDLFDAPDNIGLLYIPYKGSYIIHAWNNTTLQRYYGDIKSVEPCEWYLEE